LQHRRRPDADRLAFVPSAGPGLRDLIDGYVAAGLGDAILGLQT
jgi:hypothetical protein